MPARSGDSRADRADAVREAIDWAGNPTCTLI
jgi:hypothetical protein